MICVRIRQPACDAASARSREVSGETTDDRDAFNSAVGILALGTDRPHADLVVIVGLGDECPVGTHRGSARERQVVVDLQQLAGGRVPDPHRVVGAGGDDVLTS